MSCFQFSPVVHQYVRLPKLSWRHLQRVTFMFMFMFMQTCKSAKSHIYEMTAMAFTQIYISKHLKGRSGPRVGKVFDSEFQTRDPVLDLPK